MKVNFIGNLGNHLLNPKEEGEHDTFYFFNDAINLNHEMTDKRTRLLLRAQYEKDLAYR